MEEAEMEIGRRVGVGRRVGGKRRVMGSRSDEPREAKAKEEDEGV